MLQDDGGRSTHDLPMTNSKQSTNKGARQGGVTCAKTLLSRSAKRTTKRSTKENTKQGGGASYRHGEPLRAKTTNSGTSTNTDDGEPCELRTAYEKNYDDGMRYEQERPHDRNNPYGKNTNRATLYGDGGMN